MTWIDLFHEHRRHPTFRIRGNPLTLEYAFTCECTEEIEWRVTIRELKQLELSPRTYDLIFRLARDHARLGQWKRNCAKAEKRAKALLYKYLTREQKWELRATDSFIIIGQDGKRYRISKNECQNVFMMDGDRDKYRLCVVPKGTWIPVYDLMLIQKFMIELDIETFWSLANAIDLTPENEK
jgi:hypothetical protein